MKKNALKELKNRIENMRGLTLCEAQELYDIGYQVERGGSRDTIMQTAADICRKCGLTVTVKGIGWTISR